EISEVQKCLLISHESEIKTCAMVLMTRIGADDGESPYECGRISGSIKTEWRQHNSIAATSALHQEITVPFIWHCKRKRDSELFAVNSGASIDHAFDSAICRQRSAPTLTPGN